MKEISRNEFAALLEKQLEDLGYNELIMNANGAGGLKMALKGEIMDKWWKLFQDGKSIEELAKLRYNNAKKWYKDLGMR